eukprot:TRINITY_DN3519_c0_g1_i1.p2 TRINITY_DN3519_c0_g1~~TRINITY_DN3519_c0_g1_i1.p2  ORF type:complete len:384 (-),score=35.76 TRINITY_DN3519_c0_g1_i1:3156-4259(-)
MAAQQRNNSIINKPRIYCVDKIQNTARMSSRSKCLHSRQPDPFPLPKLPPKPLLDDPARSRCPVRGRPKGFVVKEKKSVCFQIDPSSGSNKRQPPRAMKYPLANEDKKATLAPPNESLKKIEADNSNTEDSFKAEENENELGKCVPPKPDLRRVFPSGNPRRGKSPPLREHFEAEMNKYGLLDKITNIQQLNNFFELEIGGSKKDNSSTQLLDSSASNSHLDKIFAENSPNSAKGFAFPFQKRARSNSPPRNGQLFDPKRKESPGRQPIIANFFLGKNLVSRKHVKSPEVEVPIVSMVGDTAGLSTGSTREDHCAKKGKGGVGLGDDEWMYQRLDVGGAENAAMCGNDGDKDLLKLINQLAIDCDED